VRNTAKGRQGGRKRQRTDRLGRPSRLIRRQTAIRGDHDHGPSPYEYLSAGLGACTAMTVRAYVERHNWDLRQTIVEVRHEKAAAADGTSTVDQFHRTIHLNGDLTEEQRLKLLQIAERCPVSETLRCSSIVKSRLADVSLPVPA
jgi:uncharacterized OsmC-like protein